MMHNVLKRWPHTMIGVDFHLDIMPAVPPVPNPVHCHIVGHVLNGWWLANWADKEQAEGVEIIQMGSDIANGIPHIPMPPSHFLLALLYTAASGSKSHFGPASVQTPKGPVGAALIIAVNPNLNCGCPCPTMTGVVIAPNTVEVAMTWGDIIGGFIAMYIDIVISTILNLATAKMSPLGGTLAQFMIGSPLGKTSLDLLKAITPESWHSTLTGLSWIPGFPGWGGTWGSAIGDGGRWVGAQVGDAFSGETTPTDRLWGREGTYANSSSADTVGQPADTSQAPNPASSVTDNPGVEEF